MRSLSRVWHLFLAFLQDLLVVLVGTLLIFNTTQYPLIYIAGLGIAGVALCFAPNGPASLRVISRLLFPVVLALALVAVYYKIHQLDTVDILGISVNVPLLLRLAQFDSDYQEPFYSAISTLYAIIIALALVKGMEGIDTIKTQISAEVAKVRSMWNYLTYFEIIDKDSAAHVGGRSDMRDDAVLARHGLRVVLLNYCARAGDDLAAAADPQEASALDRGRGYIRTLVPRDDDDRIAYEELVRSFDELDELRARRASALQSGLPTYLLGALWVMSVALILPFLAEPLCVASAGAAATPGAGVAAQSALPGLFSGGLTEQMLGNCPSGTELSSRRYSMYFMIFVMAGFFSFMMLLLGDLAKLDSGFWRIDTRPFRRLHGELEARHVETVNAEIAELNGLERAQLGDRLAKSRWSEPGLRSEP